MRIPALAVCLLALCSAPASAQDEGGETQLVWLSTRTFAFERIGQFTALRCGPDEPRAACALFDRMDVSPQIDWDALLDKARRAAPKKKVKTEDLAAPIASAYAVDRYNGPWKVVLSAGGGRDTPQFLLPFAARVTPDFPGYRVTLRADAVSEVEILRDAAQWQAVCKSLGLDEYGRKKKRKGLGKLFE
ncbi:MAG: hypothetical protein HY926_10440 [Elusimicrobia bacterium]|nr:hypothetical protein [Elusimicrobiota bacterium]